MARGNRAEITEEDKKRKVNKAGLRQLGEIFKYVKPYRGYFIISLLCLSLSSLFTLAFPGLSGDLIDAAQGNHPKGYTINQIVLVLLGILLVNAVLSFFRVVTSSIVSENALRDLRVALYDKLLHLPVPFFENRRVGELTSRLTADLGQLQDVFSFTLAEFVRQSLMLIVGTAIMFIRYPRLTVFMLAIFPVVVIGAIVFGKFIRTLSKQTQDALGEANTVVVETLQSVNAVKAFTNEFYEVGRYTGALKNVVSKALLAARYRGLFFSFIIFVVFGGVVVILWYASTLLATKEITSGELIGFAFYTAFIGGSIGGMSDLYSQLQKTIGASERIREILSEENEKTTLPEKKALQEVGDISFEHVNFSYPTRPDVQVLGDISLQIRSGQKIALVGHSGAGKSTITSLLLRYYQPQAGKITISGTDIEALDLKELRKNIGIVPQEVMLFGGSIAENISYGKPNATLTEIREAARKANALEFIERFPEGFDTLVGERGVKLSGGQRQRIAIARAILKDPRILILDEATSSLDAESERLVQEALDELMKNRTTIIIAHRLATIRKVDYIYVIGDGKIQEVGTHDELAESENGIYNNLLRLQFELH